MSGLRLQEPVLSHPEHVGEVWVEIDLGGVVSLDVLILPGVEDVVLAEDHLEGDV